MNKTEQKKNSVLLASFQYLLLEDIVGHIYIGHYIHYEKKKEDRPIFFSLQLSIFLLSLPCSSQHKQIHFSVFFFWAFYLPPNHI